MARVKKFVGVLVSSEPKPNVQYENSLGLGKFEMGQRYRR